MKFLLYLAIFTAPLGAKVFNFDFGPFQMSPFRLLMILSFTLYLFKGLNKHKVSSKISDVKLDNKASFSKKFFLFWLIYAFVSILWAKDIGNWFRTIYFISIGVAGIVLFSNFLKEDYDIRNAFFCLQGGIALQSIIGWYEIITRDYNFLYLSESNYRHYVEGVQRIPIAMQGNPNNFATLMFVGIFISYICTKTVRGKFMYSINWILMVNYIFLIFMSASRANILALLISLTLLLAFAGKKNIVIIVSAVIILMLTPQFNDFIQNTLNLQFDSSTGSDLVRIGLIKNGFTFLLSTFGFGVGSGQIEYWMSNYTTYYVSTITNMHNYWMEILTVYGLIVFGFFIGFYKNIFFDFYKQYKNSRNKQQRLIALSICAMLVGFIISLVSSSSNITSEWLWILWGILIAYQGIINNETENKNAL